MTVLIQPLKFWKNAAQTGQLALTFNPHILYVGTTTTWLNEIGQLALQFGFTGVFKRMAARGGDGECSECATPTFGSEVVGALAGGLAVAPFCSVLELILLQQQRAKGGGILHTVARMRHEYGLRPSSLLRGVVPCMARDSIYVGGMLGATPMFRATLSERMDIHDTTASLASSLLVGTVAGIASHPFDTIKTRMQCELRRTFSSAAGPVRAFVLCRRLIRRGQISILFGGVTARAIEIAICCLLSDLFSLWVPPYLKRITRSEDVT